jgi:hypothetical protein
MGKGKSSKTAEISPETQGLARTAFVEKLLLNCLLVN